MDRILSPSPSHPTTLPIRCARARGFAFARLPSCTSPPTCPPAPALHAVAAPTSVELKAIIFDRHTRRIDRARSLLDDEHIDAAHAAAMEDVSHKHVCAELALADGLARSLERAVLELACKLALHAVLFGLGCVLALVNAFGAWAMAAQAILHLVSFAWMVRKRIVLEAEVNEYKIQLASLQPF